MTTTSTTLFPTGAVVAYAGENSGLGPGGNGNTWNGWYLCDGTTLPSSGTGPNGVLAGVISSYYGGSSDGTSYCLPDYRGQFLRGVDGGTGRDPDAANRMQPRSDQESNGASGTQVGSRQASALQNHTHSYVLSVGTTSARLTSSGSSDPIIEVPENTSQLSDAAGSGAESRPVNQYVYFLIQAGGSDTSLQAGVVCAYAGDCSSSSALGIVENQGWLLCDGRSLSSSAHGALYAGAANDGSYGLYTNYGAASSGDFSIPCYFGRFLRGVDDGQGTDPDAATRTAPQPDLAPNSGSTGDAVGSIQDQTYPAHGHTYSFSNESNDNSSSWDDKNLPLAQTQSVQTTGFGDDETRPSNVALEFLIFDPDSVQHSSSSPSADDTQPAALPSGLVIAFAGDLSKGDVPDGWLICDGTSYDSTDSDYTDLGKAIGTIYGGSATDGTFNVPDLRGYFVRAVDHSSAYGNPVVDPGPRQAAPGGSSTGVGSSETHALATHTHGIEEQNQNAQRKDGNDTRGNPVPSTPNGQTEDPQLVTPAIGLATAVQPTLSSENRPTNMYVYFLIKM